MAELCIPPYPDDEDSLVDSQDDWGWHRFEETWNKIDVEEDLFKDRETISGGSIEDD